jgi:hypothetical protein
VQQGGAEVPVHQANTGAVSTTPFEPVQQAGVPVPVQQGNTNVSAGLGPQPQELLSLLPNLPAIEGGQQPLGIEPSFQPLLIEPPAQDLDIVL